MPYPSDDYTDVSLYLEPYEYENQNKESIVVDSPLRSRNGEVLTTSSGEEIYGINLSKSNYQCPITSINECYTIINYNYEYIGSINEKVVLNVLYDLTNHFSYKECLNSNEIYDDDPIFEGEDFELQIPEADLSLMPTLEGGTYDFNP